MRGGPGTLVVADRGASADAPEHTIAAYDLALAQGADALLLDVHGSRDLEPVVIHDFTLERTTDGAGPVVDHTVRDLKRLDAGAWRDARFAGQRLQALHEVLERFRGGMRFVLVLRGGRGCYPALAERVVSLVEIYEVVDRALVASFDPEVLREVRALSSDVAVGILATPGRDAATQAATPADVLCVDARTLTQASVTTARAGGYACYAWAVSGAVDVKRLEEWGVRGIITDRPGPVVARLGR
jgi:glycerophosphoryl diester phosphodiesterase